VIDARLHKTAIRRACRSLDRQVIESALSALQTELRDELRSRPEWAGATDLDVAVEVHSKIMTFLGGGSEE
jgi:hypothetical protein